MNTPRVSIFQSSSLLAAAAVLFLTAAVSSCQREACPGAITQTEFEQAPISTESAFVVGAEQVGS